ncbi:MAG: FtsX-like permease family protein [Thiolinea sp.]
MRAERLRMLVFIAWRNIWRNPVRSILTISAIAGSLIAVLLYSALMEGMTRQMVAATTDIATGHLQIHRQAFTDDQDMYATVPWDYLTRLEQEFPALKMAPRLYAAGLASTQDSSNGVMIKAIDPQREIHVTRLLEHVRSGRADLEQVQDSSTENIDYPVYKVVVGAQLAKNMNLTPGDELVLVTQAADGSIGNGLFRISAVLKPVEPGFDRMGVLMSVTAWQELIYLDNGFHELAIHLDDPEQITAVQAQLDQALQRLVQAEPLDELGGPLLLRNWRQLSPVVSGMLDMSGSMLLVIGAIIISLASLGLLNTQLMSIHERGHEFGILLSIGMKSRWLVLMVLLEALFLAIVSAIVGTLTGLAIYQWLGKDGIDLSGSMPDGYDWAGVALEPVMSLQLQPSHVVIACLLTLVIALIAALIPSWRMARLKPVEVMK